MPHSVFGWSYPPGCSGPPDEGRDPSPLSEAVYKLLEGEDMPQDKIDTIMTIIDKWEEGVIRQREAAIDTDPGSPDIVVDDPTQLAQ